MEESEIKYCICAMIDLLGFSNHLEISAYDLRTNIGKQAVSRLENLEQILEVLELEKKNREDYYPTDFHIQRVNDAIFITMDLDDILIPSIGQTQFRGLSPDSIQKYFSEEMQKSEEDFKTAYTEKIYNSINPLLKFIGFISRLHLSLNKLESSNHFPGAKTVISTGFRRRFLSKAERKEDFFSANFALSNAYIAEKSLHGPNLFIDEGVLQIISANKYSRNVVRLSCFHFKESTFDCFEDRDIDNSFIPIKKATIPDTIAVQLFRKTYHFRNLNPAPASYLQNLPSMLDCLTGQTNPDLSNIYYKHIFHAVKYGVSSKSAKTLSPPKSFIFSGTNDLNSDIGILQEFLSTGKSDTREQLKEKKFQEENANVSEEGKKKIRELMEQTVTLEIDPLKIEEFGDSIFDMNEESFTSFLPVLTGDFDSLDFKPSEES